MLLTMPSIGVASLMVDMIQAVQPLVLECIFASLNNALMKIKSGQLQSKLMDVAMAVPALKQNSQLATL